MKEKEIIKSELVDINKISKIIIIIGIVLGIIAFFMVATNDKSFFTDAMCSSHYTKFGGTLIYTGESESCIKYKNMSLLEYLSVRNQNSYYFALFGIILGSVVVALILKKAYKDKEIIITNKRIYGTSRFGKKFDFAIDNITSINTTALNGIKIDMAPAPKKFYLLKNNKEIYEEISSLITKN